MSRRKEKIHTDTSHLIPRSRRDEGFNVEADVNKEQWYYNKHHSYHDVFLNDLPHEAILRLLDMFQAVIRPEVKYQIEEVLSKPNSELYVDAVLKLKNDTRCKVMNVIEVSEFGELSKKEEEELRAFYRDNAPNQVKEELSLEEEYKERIDEVIERGEVPVYEENEIRNNPDISMRDAQYLLDYIKKKVERMIAEEFDYFQQTGKLPDYI